MKQIFTPLLLIIFLIGCDTQYPDLESGLYADIKTNKGSIVIKLAQEKAPITVANFVSLAEGNNDFVTDSLKGKAYYDGTIFHRVIPGFMIQGGDPNSKSEDRSSHGTGGPGYTIKAEFNSTPHARGVLSMARSQDPDSAGSQFFIVVKGSSFPLFTR